MTGDEADKLLLDGAITPYEHALLVYQPRVPASEAENEALLSQIRALMEALPAEGDSAVEFPDHARAILQVLVACCESFEETAYQISTGWTWVAINDAQPPVGQEVLVYSREWDCQIVAARRREGSQLFYTDDDRSIEDVTHWQPLGPAPQIVDEE